MLIHSWSSSDIKWWKCQLQQEVNNGKRNCHLSDTFINHRVKESHVRSHTWSQQVVNSRESLVSQREIYKWSSITKHTWTDVCLTQTFLNEDLKLEVDRFIRLADRSAPIRRCEISSCRHPYYLHPPTVEDHWLIGAESLILLWSVLCWTFSVQLSYKCAWFTLHVVPHSPQRIRAPQPNTNSMRSCVRMFCTERVEEKCCVKQHAHLQR